MNSNKESILAQITIVEDNMRRLRVLCEADLMWGGVPLYCCMKARMQLENLEKEIEGMANKVEQ